MPESREKDQGTEPQPSWEDKVLPYVLDELTPDEKQTFESALSQSDLCRVRVYETRRMVERLQRMPREQVSRDLSAAVCAQIDDRHSGGTRPALPIAYPWRLALKVAAGLLVVAGGWLVTKQLAPGGAQLATADAGRVQTERQVAVTRGLDWLARVQEPTGSWNGSKWGGSKQYTVGLTGLALMALANGQDGDLEGRYAPEIHRAVDFLKHTQNRRGVIGVGFSGTRYDHAIATCALLEVYKRKPDADLKRVLDGALRHIVAVPAPAPPESAWESMALKRAAELGWAGLIPLHGGGPKASRFDGAAVPAEARGAADLFHGYLASAGLAVSGRAHARGSELSEWQARIIASQDKEGPLAGSWGLSDRFSAAAGRVYSTSLAALTLQQALGDIGT